MWGERGRSGPNPEARPIHRQVNITLPRDLTTHMTPWRFQGAAFQTGRISDRSGKPRAYLAGAAAGDAGDAAAGAAAAAPAVDGAAAPPAGGEAGCAAAAACGWALGLIQQAWTRPLRLSGALGSMAPKRTRHLNVA